MRHEPLRRSVMRRARPHGAAFTLIELLVVIAIIAVLLSLLMPSLARGRRAARAAVCISGIGQLARASQSYCIDFQDRIFAFSWKGHSNNGLSADDPAAADLINPWDDLQAAAHQAVYIIRKRGDREDPMFPTINGWIPHVFFTHLVLTDYLAARLPDPMLVCPEDFWRRQWQDVGAYNRGDFLPNQLYPSGSGLRGPYISSYQMSPCSYDNSPVGLRVQQGESFSLWMVFQQGVLRGRKLADVEAPGSKVLLMEEFDRHTAPRTVHYGLPFARNIVAFFDGSAHSRRTADANPGWQPNDPFNPNPTLMMYCPAQQTCYPGVPDPWVPTGDLVKGYYRWTRCGLRGVDFGGMEVRGREN